jgi:hypothetical protein
MVGKPEVMARSGLQELLPHSPSLGRELNVFLLASFLEGLQMEKVVVIEL